MITKEQQMLIELKQKITKELLAHKLGVTDRTIERWVLGNNKPSYATRKLIASIYNGYKSRSKNEM